MGIAENIGRLRLVIIADAVYWGGGGEGFL